MTHTARVQSRREGQFLGIGIATALLAAAPASADISIDGKRLVSERRDRAAGTDRLIAADLTTGQTMDLFNAFETATLRPTSPSISQDGRWEVRDLGGPRTFRVR